MKKSMLNLGRALDRTEQKQINGGFATFTHVDEDGTVGRGSLCLRNGEHAHQRCKPGLRCDTGGAHAFGICR